MKMVVECSAVCAGLADHKDTVDTRAGCPPGDPHPPGTPPFPRMGPTVQLDHQSARTIRTFLESFQRLNIIAPMENLPLRGGVAHPFTEAQHVRPYLHDLSQHQQLVLLRNGLAAQPA